MAKRFFEARGIQFEEYDITQDKAARERAFWISHQQGVPVIEIGDEIFVGFDRKGISEKLGIS